MAVLLVLSACGADREAASSPVADESGTFLPTVPATTVTAPEPVATARVDANLKSVAVSQQANVVPVEDPDPDPDVGSIVAVSQNDIERRFTEEYDGALAAFFEAEDLMHGVVAEDDPIVPPRPALPAGERWVADESVPHIAVTPSIDGWYPVQIWCDGWLDWVSFKRYDDFGPPAGDRIPLAGLYVGPIYQDCPFDELVEGLPEIGVPGRQATIGMDQRPAIRFELTAPPDWDYLGVRYMPSGHAHRTLYLIDGEERDYFVYITATADTFDEFSELAESLLQTLELDVGL
jgi:hypothetical protein